MDRVRFSFFGVVVSCEGEPSVLEKLKQDFSFFLISEDVLFDFKFELNLTRPNYNAISGLKACKQSLNSVTYDLGRLRFNDYYGKALTQYNYDKELGIIQTKDKDLLHEISYLMILSRVGKKLDKKGYHKMHAMGVAYRRTALIIMMPMKGGKSTLFILSLIHI